MDVAKKVRKSYEQFAFNERKKDGSEAPEERGHQERKHLHQHFDKQFKASDVEPLQQQNNRYLSVGFAGQTSSQKQSSTFVPNVLVRRDSSN